MRFALALLFLFASLAAHAFQVSGRVTGSDGYPVAYASIFVKNSTYGVATNLMAIEIGGETGFRFIGFAGEGSVAFDEPPVLGEPPTLRFSAELWLNDGSGPGGPLGGF